MEAPEERDGAMRGVQLHTHKQGISLCLSHTYLQTYTPSTWARFVAHA